jgi:hypothetical protein
MKKLSWYIIALIFLIGSSLFAQNMIETTAISSIRLKNYDQMIYYITAYSIDERLLRSVHLYDAKYNMEINQDDSLIGYEHIMVVSHNTFFPKYLTPSQEYFESIAENDIALLSEDPEYIYRIDTPLGKKLVKMSDEQIQQIEQARAQLKLDKEQAKQSMKSVEQRQYENKFFQLTELILIILEDPRAGQSPPTKLTMQEITGLLEQFSDTSFEDSTMLSLNLLAIDSALKRYSTLWWDDVHYHTDIISVQSNSRLNRIRQKHLNR